MMLVLGFNFFYTKKLTPTGMFSYVMILIQAPNCLNLKLLAVLAVLTK